MNGIRANVNEVAEGRIGIDTEHVFVRKFVFISFDEITIFGCSKCAPLQFKLFIFIMW